MAYYTLEREQWLPACVESVFDFFSEPSNLGRITPPWMGWRMLEPVPDGIRAGTRIDYRIRLAGVPMRWRTCINEWKPPFRFSDTQERGPYAHWEHVHEFEPCGVGVLMRDTVHYRLPLGVLGRVAHALAVRATLGAIFDYRFREIRSLLGGAGNGGAGDGSAGGDAGDPGALAGGAAR